MTDPIDFVISFDTTGSMYPCLSEVRRKVEDTVTRLFSEIPNLRVGIIAHGDYCDERSTYVTKHLPLTTDAKAVSTFIKTVSSTSGGDFPECYELVLHEAANITNWSAGSKKILALIGDATPHPPAHNPKRLDWRKEVENLTAKGILVHGVQCLNHGQEATNFWAAIAEKSGGLHLRLSQFNEATDLLMAVAYQQQSPEALQKYEDEVVAAKRMTRSMSAIFDKLTKRDSKGRFRKVDALAVDESRFQKIEVEHDKVIKELVEENGLVFQKGRGFYEFTKREEIQAYKEIVILDKTTGDMYEGAGAREVLGLADSKVSIRPDYDKTKYSVFVQSTSNNRKLIGGTTFLYETTKES